MREMNLGRSFGSHTTFFVLNFFFIPMIVFLICSWDLAHGENYPFPTYGSGDVQVRIYTDYFCPPCRRMEPEVEPILKNLMKRKVITLTVVDTPFHRHSALYARYFLYAIRAKNTFQHALKVRNILFEAAERNQITTPEGIEKLYWSKKIPFTVFDPKPVFERFNTLFQEDNIKSTPSCVIVQNGTKEIFVGSTDIINALKKLQ